MAVYVFGSNIMGQCGLPEEQCSTHVPTETGLSGDKIACGYLHALLVSAGKLVTWGVNDEGALGRAGSELPGVVEIGENVVEVSAGGSVSAAVTESGGLYIWGTFRDAHGIFGLTPDCRISERPVKVLENVARVTCGKNFVAATTKNNALVTFGMGENNELGYKASTRVKRCLLPRQISNRYKKEEKFVDVFSGCRYGMAVNRERRLFSWEGGGVKAVMGGVKTVAMGTHHCHVVTDSGVYARGINLDGQLGIGWKGKVESEEEWVKMSGFENVSKIRTKMDFSIAQIGNELYSWGPSTFGETGFEQETLFPAKIPFDFGEVVDFSVGSDFSVVVTK